MSWRWLSNQSGGKSIKHSEKIGILLTACIAPRVVSYLVRRDPAIRLEDYKRALILWLANLAETPIVFCDNSGYDLSEIYAICQPAIEAGRQVELLSYREKDFPLQLGKGYGEMGIIAYALEHSRMLANCDFILKVTGRHYVQNAAALLTGVNKATADIYCDLRFNLAFADSRVFCASKGFYQDYLFPLREILNDSEGQSFEHVLATAVHQAMAHRKRWTLFSQPPDIRGVNATADEVIPSSWIWRIRRTIFRDLKAYVLSR